MVLVGFHIRWYFLYRRFPQDMIFYRYIIREQILPLLYCLVTIVFLFMMQLAVDLLRKILYKGIDVSVIIELFLFNMAWMIVLAVPMAILVSTLMTFGRMSADNEITAIKASGQNLLSMTAPIFSAAILLTAMMIFFHNDILPDSNHRCANLMTDISMKKPAALIEPGILIRDFENYAMIVDDVEHKTGKLKNVKIFSDIPGEDPATTVADSGFIQLTTDQKYLELILFNGETHSVKRENNQGYYVGKFEKHLIFIPNVDSRLRRTVREYRGDREKSSQMLLVDVQSFKDTKAQIEQAFNNELGRLASACRESDSSVQHAIQTDTDLTLDTIRTFEQWKASLARYQPGALQLMDNQRRLAERIQIQVRREKANINQYLVEVHKKYSTSFACIVFAFIGIPLGIMARHGGLAVGAAYSIFFFILYWSFLMAGERLGDNLIIPAWLAMWSCNIVLGLIGLFLSLRMLRETTFINYAPLIKLWHAVAGMDKKVKPHKLSLAALPFRIPWIIMKKSIGTVSAYLMRIFLINSAMVFLAIVVIFVIIDYISNMSSFENASLYDIILYYWYYLAWFVGIIFPIGILLSSMFSMGILSKHSELTAIKAAGISVRRLTMPLLFFGLFLSVFSFLLSEKILPSANATRKQIMEDFQSGKKEHTRHRILTDRSNEMFSNFYYFSDKNTSYRFSEFRANPFHALRVQRTRFSTNAILENTIAESMAHDSLKKTWHFIKGQRKSFGDSSYSQVAFDTLTDSVLGANPNQMVARIKSVDYMSYWELKNTMELARKRGEKISRYQADLYFKVALPFMNFIVMFIGLSIIARVGKKGINISFGIGLGLVFTYWIMSQFMLSLGKNETMNPMLAAWAGNIIFLCVGLFLYRKASR